MKIKTLFIIFILIITACKVDINKNKKINEANSEENKYAQGFSIQKYDDFNKLVVRNPWQTATNEEFNYYLFSSGVKVPDSLTNEIIIRTPVEKVICLSTTHLGFIEKLNLRDAVIGISGTNFVYDSILQQKIKLSEIEEIGFEDNLNTEKIISLKPDIVFAYDISGSQTAKFEQLQKFGINVIYIGEYLETDPLGKAEWLVFVSHFFEKEKIASEIFNQIESEYLGIDSVMQNLENKPGILINTPFQGIWYQPGGKSYVSKIISDAGGNYLWKDNTSRESFTVSMEEIFVRNAEIDILINPGIANTIAEIINSDSRLSALDCIKNKKVFNNTKRQNKYGGNDFWESGTVNPHLILRDLALIFRGDKIEDIELYYYKKM